jgi:cation-transporting ATPase 13A2
VDEWYAMNHFFALLNNLMGIPVQLGWLMISMGVLSVFNALTLLSPPQNFIIILELMPLPFSARCLLLLVAAINVILSMIYEQWGSGGVAHVVGRIVQWHRGRRRYRGGNV